ncbi:MAG: YfhO family protein [candidate division WOR-3 bacterium]
MPRKRSTEKKRCDVQTSNSFRACDTTSVFRISESSLHRSVIVVLFVLPFVFYYKHAFSDHMLFGTDWLGAGSFHWRNFMAQYIRTHGNIALWWPAILSGQPTVAGFFADLFYPTTIFRLFLPVHVVWTWTFILHIFIAGLGTYLFLKELKLGVIPSALAGVAYMFSGSLMTLAFAGHDGRLIGSALMPLALFFLQRGIDRRRLLQFLLCGLVVALQLFSGHLQKVYYTGLILLAYFLFQWIRSIRHERSTGVALRLALYFGIGMGFGLALAAIQYLPVFGNLPFAARGHERGYEYATSWSMPIIETLDLLTPRFSGGLEHYWGANPFKLHSEYLGILPLLFAVIAVFRCWKNRVVKFFTFSFAFSLLMAWGGGTPFYYVPYYLLPGISKVRGPAMIFFLAGFSVCALAAIGVHHLLQTIRTEKQKFPRSLMVGAAVPIILLLVFAVAREPVTALLRPAPQKLAAFEANYSAVVTGFLLASVIASIGILLCWLLLRRRVRPELFAILSAAVMTFDISVALNLWDGSKGYIRSAPPPTKYYAADSVVAFLSSDTSRFRVLPMHYERSEDGILAYHGIQSVAGQLPNPLQTYQDFIGAGSSVMFQTGNLVYHNFTDLLNVKYIISYTLPEDASRYDPGARRTIEQLRAYFSDPRFEPVFVTGRYTVYRNKNVLPRTFIAPGYEVMPDKDAVFARLMQDGFDPSRTCLLYDTPGFLASTDTFAMGMADIIEYDANAIAVRAVTAVPGLLVLSENFHPDWKAYLDGRRVPVLRAYHTLRAVALPPGEHEVIFKIESRDYRYGSLISLAALAFFVGAVVVTVATRRGKETIICR